MELRSQERSYWRRYPLAPVCLWSRPALAVSRVCAARGATALHGQGAQGHRAVASPRISLLCLREHPRAAGWGCGWS